MRFEDTLNLWIEERITQKEAALQQTLDNLEIHGQSYIDGPLRWRIDHEHRTIEIELLMHQTQLSLYNMSIKPNKFLTRFYAGTLTIIALLYRFTFKRIVKSQRGAGPKRIVLLVSRPQDVELLVSTSAADSVFIKPQPYA